jgi:LuxR family maltose regulon positive regulatory protein
MGRLPAAGILHVALSEVLVERNALEAAEAHLEQGLELGQWSGRLDAARNAAPARSRLLQARGDLGGALAAVEEAEATLGDPPSALAKGELLALKAQLLARRGSLGEAAACADQAVRLAGWDRGLTGARVALAATRARIGRCAPEEAVADLARSLAAAEKAGRWGAAIELRVLRGLAHARRGDRRGARADLERALALAEPEGYARVFMDEGPPAQGLLARWVAQAGPGPLRDYALRLLAQFGAERPAPLAGVPAAGHAARPAESAPQAPVEPLSERELEVLALIALGRTNPQIARQLVVAPGTVKAHASHIYRKLDVTNRTEAVARARQLGLIP